MASHSNFFDLALNKTSLDYIIPGPNTLDFSGNPNQQFRMDILASGSSFDSLDPADVLTNVYQTLPGDSLELDWTTISMGLTGAVTPYAGQSVQLRFAGIDYIGPFGVGFDNVKLAPVSEPSVTAAGFGLIPLVICFGRRVARKS